MFRAKTIFVIGAGASAEFGMPLGGALLEAIASKVDIRHGIRGLEHGDHVISQALKNALDSRSDVALYNEHLHSAWQLVESSKLGLSIDNVLDALEDPKASTVGKFGIVRSILESEEQLALSGWVEHFPDQINVEDYSDTWLDRFSKLLTENVRKSDLKNVFDNICLINFNYDRIVEQYLPFAISRYYGVPVAQVREIFRDVPVYRPYGKAGELEWESGDGKVMFGHARATDVETAAPQILTFTEQVQDAKLIEGIQSAVSNADRIVFLGFGFHRQNIGLLAQQAQKHVQIFGTSYGMSKTDSEAVADELEVTFGLDQYTVLSRDRWTKLYPLKCADFLSEIWRTLTSEPGPDITHEMPELTSPRVPFPDFNWPGLTRG